MRVASTDDSGRTKQLWKRGYRTLRWEAEDGNEDELRYRLSFRPEGSGGAWLPVVEDLEQIWFSFDATALPDGVYRFRLSASDLPADPLAAAQLAERTSPPVVIDHTPPTAAAPRYGKGTLEVELSDALSPLREASYSLDAGAWQPARTVDGLLDGRRETFRIEVDEGVRIVLLRVTDSQFNVLTLDLGDKKKP